MVITVGSSGTLGIGGMVITDGSEGRRWRCDSPGAGGCWAGGRCGGACCGGAAGGADVLEELSDGVVLEVVLLLVVVLVVLEELVCGAGLPPPGPRLVSWMMPQITSPSITAISANQAISTDRRRNQGVGVTPAKSAVSASAAGC
ncbi:hypothetical protein A5772_18620 [Mycolicibacter sinensis]|jgi:hypothetical protein|uniref:Uncharacterized protein n=1 Tax=Mycolicibacter sinensis (strain JDM601) TaxID=875328 RepID=A0A1A2EIY2_MYCSD|nr:hypothetical protein A5772_18620 [Mycolicibacter sinensis]OBG04771.1 hypothetical protein A5771_10975 [Mycolicibacter sinensis]